jgi:hypothetical protein
MHCARERAPSASSRAVQHQPQERTKPPPVIMTPTYSNNSTPARAGTGHGLPFTCLRGVVQLSLALSRRGCGCYYCPVELLSYVLLRLVAVAAQVRHKVLDLPLHTVVEFFHRSAKFHHPSAEVNTSKSEWTGASPRRHGHR